MWKAVRLGLCLGIMSLIAILLLYPKHLPYSFAVNYSALEYEPVDLGTVGPNEHREFELSLTNLGAFPVSLLPPISDCGCLLVDPGPITLRSFGTAQRKVVYHAPEVPGDIKKKVLLTSADKSTTWAGQSHQNTAGIIRGDG